MDEETLEITDEEKDAEQPAPTPTIEEQLLVALNTVTELLNEIKVNTMKPATKPMPEKVTAASAPRRRSIYDM